MSNSAGARLEGLMACISQRFVCYKIGPKYICAFCMSKQMDGQDIDDSEQAKGREVYLDDLGKQPLLSCDFCGRGIIHPRHILPFRREGSPRWSSEA